MSDVTTVSAPKTPKPLSDSDEVSAFAQQTKLKGETPIIKNLWDNKYRINYYLLDKGYIARSLFVVVSEGKIEIPEGQ